ncbi:MAG: glutamate-semialdehyde -aminomutase [Thermoleophilaceae bacterium]|jgi:glutamate-1-semialdehyde 2,1-aminomutase|nr:glutamate-semialdehyde -aminomutase [Thermoleophilaceae bacterium]
MGSQAPTLAATRYAQSRAQIERAGRTLAGGVATAMRAAQRPVPLVIDHGHGSRLVDVDGNEYVDYVLGFGPMLLGHSPQPVIDAVTAQVGRGFTYGAQHRLEAELAERVVDTVPCAELVVFSTTGSEAVHAALRIARAATGRSKIVKFEGHYHGWLDPVHVATPGLAAAAPDTAVPMPSVPGTGGQSPADDVLVARWNDLEALERLLTAHGAEVAAVIMEPVASNGGLIPPTSGYLEGARRLTEGCGALLIFDEVVTGFRLALGGAQERFGVTPDLATYGKAIAAGMPVAAVAGSRDVMQVVADGRVRHVGTFNCAPVGAAAAVAALDVYRAGAPGLYERLEQVAVTLAAGLLDAASAADVPLRVHQVGPLLQTFIADPELPITSYSDTATADAEGFALFAELMLERGVNVLPRGWWFISTEHTSEDVELTLAAARDSFAEISNQRKAVAP